MTVVTIFSIEWIRRTRKNLRQRQSGGGAATMISFTSADQRDFTAAGVGEIGNFRAMRCAGRETSLRVYRHDAERA